MKMRHVLACAAAPAAVIFSGVASPVFAQQLSNGDYQQCSVYDEDGDFAGYDSVCLERKRAQLRRYQEDQANAYSASSTYSAPYYCPYWANNGAGYPGTVYSGSGYVSTDPYGTFDRPVDGVRCIPKPTYYGTGYY